MRLRCPICGERDVREFYYQGAAVMLDRPAPDAGEAAWDDYLHLRDNQPGDFEELWCHEAGCGAWIKVVRNTATHTFRSSGLVMEAKR
ncbi:MAG: sarcosine oxidase subunit delta [Pseudomonadota bacterium]